MSETQSIQATPENAAELLEAAAKAQAEHDGTATEEPEEQTQDAEASGDETKASEEDTDDSLEIKKTESDDSGDSDESGERQTFSMEDVFAEYTEHGALTEETNSKLVGALEAAGFDNAQGIIDQYIAGAQASVATLQTTAYSVVDGKENYAAMAEWAAENLSEAQLAAYNDAVTDPNLVETAVAGLHARWQASEGTATRSSNPRGTPQANVAGSGAPIRSVQEISRLTADSRFDKDPAFRADVEARIQAGIDAGYLQ